MYIPIILWNLFLADQTMIPCNVLSDHLSTPKHQKLLARQPKRHTKKSEFQTLYMVKTVTFFFGTATS